MTTDTELRPGTPVELELSLLDGDEGSRRSGSCTIARGKVVEVKANPDPDELAYIVKMSVDVVERDRAAA